MSKALNEALRLLVQREQSASELLTKLQNKGYSEQESLQAITECQRTNAQSDQRFAEMLCRTRIRQGYGPNRLHQELKMKGVDANVIGQALAEYEDDWLQFAINAWQKKFKDSRALSKNETSKQQRFLLYRGFSAEIIKRLFKEITLKI